MFRKTLISIIVLYFLVLFQTSFLVHFALWGVVPNLVMLLVIILSIYDKQDSYLGLYNAVIGGFFLDIFSNRIIGFNILILVILSILLKLIFNKYVRIPFKKI